MAKSTFKNLDAMPTWQIREILNDAPYFRNSTGTDFGPVSDYLYGVLWEREHNEAQKLMATYARQEKEYMKHTATSHKRKLA